jgi:hypothetical protein
VAVATGEKPRAAAQPAEAPEPRLLQPGKVTLEDVVLGLWEDLSAEGRTFPVAAPSDTTGAR